jgi:spore coat polysaccharide biosynthesis protein SpsF
MAEELKNHMGIVLQARMGSIRLPGKVLMPLGDTTLLGWIVRRLRDLPLSFVVATGNKLQDDAISRLCEQMSIHYFRGSEHDVLDRFYQCAVFYSFQHIIRLTGDNPFPDIDELNNLISLHLTSGADYTNSFASLPIGVGAEIFTFSSLEKSWQEGKALHHREHVNEYILENPRIFKTALMSVSSFKNRPDLRLTVDTMEDYKKACFIIEKSRSDYVTTKQAIEFAEEYARKAI